ncbi:ATP-binding cassette domain-containing protein [Pedobacter sp. HMF7647]|uniref:ATP-binding cassette domain-containing protein n=1 Tax=Hufsiella arboris TaxID=2695275 RepID=A0A7K1Y834_9SPHI|nr:ATP-binding cassette domain-containing protein [Hufsiella arboris]
MSTKYIGFNEVTKQYSPEINSGVKSISVSIEKGKITAIVGESGSGKSTFLKLLFGLQIPDSGEIQFNGERIKGPSEKLIPGHDSMRMVTQDFDLNLYAKVYDNIAALLPNTDLKFKNDRTMEMLDFFRITHLAGKRAADLSGGERQRVAIARAIITQPEVLLLDEPFSQVDTILKNHLRADLRRISHELGTTIILVSHDPVDGLSLADELIVMRLGELIEKGKPEDLYQNPAALYTARLLGNCNVLTAAEASKIGIKISGSQTAIYPEWIKVTKSWLDKIYTVRDIFFLGNSEELLVKYQDVTLRVLNHHPGTYKINDSIHLAVNRHLDFD